MYEKLYTISGNFPQTGIFHRFSRHYPCLEEQRRCVGQGEKGVQRPFLCVNEPKNRGVRKAHAGSWQILTRVIYFLKLSQKRATGFAFRFSLFYAIIVDLNYDCRRGWEPDCSWPAGSRRGCCQAGSISGYVAHAHLYVIRKVHKCPHKRQTKKMQKIFELSSVFLSQR